MAKKTKAWAVVDAKGRLVVNDGDHLHPLLVFDKKWLAKNAKWNDGERVVPVEIVIQYTPMKLRCPKCQKTQLTWRDKSDPNGTNIVESPCPECQDCGDRPETHYYDAEGRWFNGEQFVHITTPSRTDE